MEKKNVEKSLAGGIWLCIAGGLGILSFFANETLNISQVIVFIMLALCLPLGIWIIVKNKKFNNEHIEEINQYKDFCNKQLDSVFTAKCMKCANKFDYTLRQVQKHKRWPNGYIDCPYCRAHNPHCGNNKKDNLTEV